MHAGAQLRSSTLQAVLNHACRQHLDNSDLDVSPLCVIVQVVVQRYNVFSIFLVIPTGFLRALASKQIQLDEDNDSDEESDMGDAGQPTQEEQQADDKSKVG